MGVINLGLLVDKIKRKLEISGFIKKTDYATASAAGVVKIGDNIDVDDGVISVTFPPATGGVTVDTLWSGSVSTTASSIKDSLTHPISDYKMIMLYRIQGGSSCEGGVVIPVQTIGQNGVYYYFKNLAQEVLLIVTENDVTINSSSSTVSGVQLCGIK